ncbi:hypothetical protein R1flu_021418 [Riccia fluitans]|uniref:Uncharacterized protein n=1 Tax=Riccia fluitans TaxID=41844 RepID=A0ABD1ZPN1_9MARC
MPPKAKPSRGKRAAEEVVEEDLQKQEKADPEDAWLIRTFVHQEVMSFDKETCIKETCISIVQGQQITFIDDLIREAFYIDFELMIGLSRCPRSAIVQLKRAVPMIDLMAHQRLDELKSQVASAEEDAHQREASSPPSCIKATTSTSFAVIWVDSFAIEESIQNINKIKMRELAICYN